MKPDDRLIPREVLFGNPEKTAPQISPDGSRIAYLAPKEGVLNVWVRTAGKADDRPVTDDKDRGIRRYFWAHDGKHILYLKDKGGNENWRLFGVNLDTGDVKDFTPFDDVQVNVVGFDKHFPRDIMLGINKDNPRLKDVYHLDLETAELTLRAKNPGNIIGWAADRKMKIRGALAMTPDGKQELLVRSDESSDWKVLVTWTPEDVLSASPVGFTRDGKHIFLNDPRDVNATRLVKMEIETGDIEEIASDPEYDVGGTFIHPDTYEIQAVRFTKARWEWHILDKEISDDFSRIEVLDDGDFFIYNRDHANSKWLVGFTKDSGPIPFYVYDRTTRDASFLFNHQPALEEYKLASMEPFSFEARDGLTIHGYLTFPQGKERKNLPTVLNVHGGPWHRDTWGFDPYAQLMANRGYLCIQVNFRGSTGYGKEFLNAANREWGGKMHDDLIDAVNWAVEKGFADKKKVAIFGGSYGGYAALVGATFTPDFFSCAVDMVGISNLLTFMKTVPPYWKPMLPVIYERVGHPEKDREFLKSRSPLFKVDNIKIPMLIAQGANDPRVVKAESDQIVEAMKSKGIDHEYMVFENEGHGFTKPENRMAFIAAAERFLSKHLGGRFEE